MATEPPPETTASNTHDETTKVAVALGYGPRWPSPLDYAEGDCVFARETAERGYEGARWRRGIVTAKYTSGRMKLTFDNGSKSGYLGHRPSCGSTSAPTAA